MLPDGLPATGGEDLPFPSHGLKHVTRTNLHTHGLHIGGEADADNIFLSLAPGASFTHRYPVRSRPPTTNASRLALHTQCLTPHDTSRFTPHASRLALNLSCACHARRS